MRKIQVNEVFCLLFYEMWSKNNQYLLFLATYSNVSTYFSVDC